MKSFSNAWKKAPKSFQALEKTVAPLLLALLLPLSASAQSPIFRPPDREHLRRALSALDMTETDTRFRKDYGNPLLSLNRPRELLDEPLKLPALADEILAVCSRPGPSAELWLLAADLLETKIAELPPRRKASFAFPSMEPALSSALEAFMTEAAIAGGLLDESFAGISPEDKQYAAAQFLVGMLEDESREDAIAALVPSTVIDRAIAESEAIDPAPAASNMIAIAQSVDFAAMLAAGHVFQAAVYRLHESAADVKEWPRSPVHLKTELGLVCIGTAEDDAHAAKALLILDPGGDDSYLNVGGANGMAGRPLVAIVDFAGNDCYESDEAIGPGAGLWGIAIALDADGNDLWRARHLGQGAGAFGIGWLEDKRGDDVYSSGLFGQAAGFAGLGWLHDRDGNDFYGVGHSGQAYAGVLGVGLLLDRAGHDGYRAGGNRLDHERNGERRLSLGQGFSIGIRPFAGGGVAALMDLAGNDSYYSEVYGQGVSYWYSVGMLIDAGGHDHYSVHQYGQGAGIHMSCGLLADLAGDDSYTGRILVQGSAHDYGVGMLFDHSGDDAYSADHHAQGRALYNAFALAIDSDGNDTYFGRRIDECQGIGMDGDKREYGSLALLLDLAGVDFYTSGAKNGEHLLRPDFGIVYDFEQENEDE